MNIEELQKAIEALSPEECLARYLDQRAVALSCFTVVIAHRDKRITDEQKAELLDMCIEMYDNVAAPTEEYTKLVAKGKKLFDDYLPDTGENLTAEQRKKMI